ncbi:hypothetical protein OROMI_008079 [Orobanche minor]
MASSDGTGLAEIGAGHGVGYAISDRRWWVRLESGGGAGRGLQFAEGGRVWRIGVTEGGQASGGLLAGEGVEPADEDGDWSILFWIGEEGRLKMAVEGELRLGFTDGMIFGHLGR